MPVIKQYPIYVGVDPGASGGIAALSGGKAVTYAMPATTQDVWAVFEALDEAGAEAFAVIEKVSGYVGEAQPGSSAFKFGQSYGSLLMALTAAQIPFEEVTPQKWQKAMGVTPRIKARPPTHDKKSGESKTQFKNRLKQKAQQLFPTIEVTLAVADALLIAEFCRRKREGKL